MDTMVALVVVVAIATFVRGRSGGRARGFVWLDGRARRSVEVVLSRWIDAVAVFVCAVVVFCVW